MTNESASDRVLLRHTLATVAYRAAKALRDAPAGFEGFRAAETLRTPGQILAHMGDLFDWALTIVKGEQRWHESSPLSWPEEVDRFYATLQRLDEFLASDVPLSQPAERLFQGPIADALTHVGQLALLRRLAGQPVRGENYFKADIASGRTGLDQASPKVAFD